MEKLERFMIALLLLSLLDFFNKIGNRGESFALTLYFFSQTIPTVIVMFALYLAGDCFYNLYLLLKAFKELTIDARRFLDNVNSNSLNRSFID